MRFVIRLIVNAVAIWLTAQLLTGINLMAATDAISQVLEVGIIALVFTLVNMTVKPLAHLLSLPLIVLTLGLFSLVINALMLMLTGWISTQVGHGLQVDGFWWAVGGAIVISLVSWALNLILPDPS